MLSLGLAVLAPVHVTAAEVTVRQGAWGWERAKRPAKDITHRVEILFRVTSLRPAAGAPGQVWLRGRVPLECQLPDASAFLRVRQQKEVSLTSMSPQLTGPCVLTPLPVGLAESILAVQSLPIHVLLTGSLWFAFGLFVFWLYLTVPPDRRYQMQPLPDAALGPRDSWDLRDFCSNFRKVGCLFC